ncbi:uncharacterized protein GIQ15_01285 [Arthroderma uncinatum]|uniref:uncharacterized protein n=1 Tax=Arthroderma uncinatum TaxID=74035 RepID=UPI00144A7605|nr:uncharacterized protein GIQ15_01285 [Arthroderma uncinatum]KAF3491768.1 hypothetical protein GIQ15_01285 [Arthroderma uncinatum]
MKAIIDKESTPGEAITQGQPMGGARTGPDFEPIAIVGVAMRLPGGVRSTDAFWDFLVQRRDGNCEVPDTRYNIEGFYHPSQPHYVKTKHGYFLEEDPAMFDAEFFGIAGSDAERLDPQQRLLLEVVWECLENAGESKWRGENIGCYVGVFGGDWLEIRSMDKDDHNRYDIIGTGDFSLSNHISYRFDLRGPSMTIETGCSASMVGLHEACQALYLKSCSAAIVGGTNLILGPDMTTKMSDNMVLSPEGVCHTFDEKANGYGRGEAVNAIYIKRLSDALRNGDPIRAVIRSTAANFDGATTAITNPCPLSQEALIRSAYRRAGIQNIFETGFFECHGTATQVGDITETTVIAKLCHGHDAIIGAVKPNVGHSEGASGLTSVIKAVLALERRTIPPNAHFETPNPNLPLKEGNLTVPVAATPWPENRAERVSVNSFGILGSNAHAVLESASSLLPSSQTEPRALYRNSPHLLVISAQSAESLQSRSRQILDYVKEHPSKLQDLAYTLALRRQHLSHRAFAIVKSNQLVNEWVIQSSQVETRQLVFIFTGQGAQWPGMGRDLIEHFEGFRNDILEMGSVLEKHPAGPDWCLEEELLKTGNESRVYEAALSQPLCTALQIGIVNTLRRWGLSPSAVIGHSSGEIAAAYAAGGITMEEAILVAYHRGLAINPMQGTGSMVAIGLGCDDIKPYLQNSVSIACENSPRSVTLSGTSEDIDQVISKIQEDNPETYCRRLRVSVPYHSSLMHQVGGSYETALAPYVGQIKQNSDMLPFFSTVTSTVLTEPHALDASYWRNNLEKPVLFSKGVSAVLKEVGKGSVAFMEVGPHSALSGPLRQIFEHTPNKGDAVYIPTITRVDNPDSHDSRSQLLASVGAAYSNGFRVDLERVIESGSVLTDLPPYPWKHELRYWRESRLIDQWRMRGDQRHELLGARTSSSPDLEPSWRNMLSLESVPWVEEHVLGNQIIFPGAGYIAMAGEAVKQLHPGTTGYSIRNLIFKTAMVLQERQKLEVITTLHVMRYNDTMDSEWYAFTIMAHDGATWIKHCHGDVRPNYDYPPVPAKITSHPRQVRSDKWYQTLAKRRIVYGERFRGMKDITAHPTQRVAAATVTDDPKLHSSRYTLHPTAIDQCLQAVSVAWAHGLSRRLEGMGIPAAIEQLYVGGTEPKMTLGVEVADAGKGKQLGDAVLMGDDDEVFFSMRQALFVSIDENLSSDTPRAPLASYTAWKPDIDFLPPTALLRRMPPPPEGFKQALEAGDIASLCAIINLAEKLTNVQPATPQMVKYKEWIIRKYTQIRQGLANTPPEVDEYLRLDADGRTAFDHRLALIYEECPISKLAIDMIRVITHNCVDFAFDTMSPLGTLMDGGKLESYYETSLELFDLTYFLPILGHSKPNLRVLEIGAGTGAMTAVALKNLTTPEGSPLYSTYTFTDISLGFSHRATQKFSNYDNVEYKLLDITKCPQKQGFSPHSYDLVIASNVLHATPSLHEALKNIHQLLTPQGWLLLHELNPASISIDVCMGVLSGWWVGENDERIEKPHVSPERWDRELHLAGFTGNEASIYDLDDSIRLTFMMLTRPSQELKVANDISSSNVKGMAMPVTSPVFSSAAQENKHGEAHATSSAISILTAGEPSWWALNVASGFSDEGYNVTWETVSSHPLPGQCIISLLDLHSPYLYGMDEEKYCAFQQYMGKLDNNQLIWVSPLMQMQNSIIKSDPHFGMSIGFIRTLRREKGQDIVTIELDKFDKGTSATLLQLAKKIYRRDIHLQANIYENEYAVCNSVVYLPRLYWGSPSALLPAQGRDSAALKLAVGTYGLADTLHWAFDDNQAEVELEPNEVQIDVKFNGLNFRDIMIMLGVLGDASELGLECSGIVRRVGSAVNNFKPGDRVCACWNGLFRSQVICPQEFCFHVEDEHDLEGAATWLSAYGTAIWALQVLANLKEDETVLIHSACGAVGLASIRICQHAHAKIYATVGSEEKAQYLVETFSIPRNQIFHSRDSSFLPGLMRETNGRGVDVVLNSLAGKLLRVSWECVAPFGKMIELGKRDILSHATLDMSPFKRNRAFFAVELRDLITTAPDRITKSIKFLSALDAAVKNGLIQPIRPTKVFSASEVVEAFRYMQSGTHMGKIVIRMPEGSDGITCPPSRPTVRFSSDASYLLVGGLGGIGKSVSTWMVENGARHITYLSRSAGQSLEDRSFLAELKTQGCSATAVAGSVVNLGDVKLAISQSTRPLAGVIHMSMVLQDEMFEKMTYNQWKTAIAPKVEGAWNLHRALEGETLDFFVVFGSITGVLGNVGQVNYTAANTYLDSFAHYRRDLGLPCSVLHLGAVGDVGMVSRDDKVLQRLRASGYQTLSEDEVMEGLTLSIRQSSIDTSSVPQIYSTNIGLKGHKLVSDSQFSSFQSSERRIALYYNLKCDRETKETTKNERIKELLADIESNPPILDEPKTELALCRELAALIAERMAMKADMDDEKMANIAIDSLMAIEVRSTVRRYMHVDIGLVEITKAGTVKGLAKLTIIYLKAKHQRPLDQETAADSLDLSLD